MSDLKRNINTFDDYESIRRERLSASTIAEIDAAAEQEVAFLRTMQHSIRTALLNYMEKEGIGINELTKRLDTSSRQTSRIMKGEANVTLATIASITRIIGCMPELHFKLNR